MLIDGKKHFKSIINKKVSTIEALNNLFVTFAELLSQTSYDLAFIEDYAIMSGHAKSMTVMPEVGGVIKLAFYNYGVPLLPVPVSTWKALTIGTRVKKQKKAEKESYRQNFFRMYGFKPETIDVCDAYMIYDAVKKINSGEHELKPGAQKFRLELINFLNNNKRVLSKK